MAVKNAVLLAVAVLTFSANASFLSSSGELNEIKNNASDEVASIHVEAAGVNNVEDSESSLANSKATGKLDENADNERMFREAVSDDDDSGEKEGSRRAKGEDENSFNARKFQETVSDGISSGDESEESSENEDETHAEKKGDGSLDDGSEDNAEGDETEESSEDQGEDIAEEDTEEEETSAGDQDESSEENDSPSFFQMSDDTEDTNDENVKASGKADEEAENERRFQEAISDDAEADTGESGRAKGEDEETYNERKFQEAISDGSSSDDENEENSEDESGKGSEEDSRDVGSEEESNEESDASAFLQLSSYDKLWKPIVAEANPSISTKTDDMESAITQLVMGKGGAGATPMGGSVKKIKDLISKTMMPAVIDAHNAQQSELRKLIKQVHACSTAKATAWKVISKFKTKYLKTSVIHKACRADEAVKYTSMKSCFKEQGEKHRIKVLKCTIFAQTSKRFGDGNQNRQIVKRGGSESVDSYIRRISATICGRKPPKGGFLDIYIKTRTECIKASKEHSDQVRKCNKAQKDYRKKKSQCNTVQSVMDASACKRAVLVKDACETYSTCYKSKMQTYLTTKKAVQQEEKDRKGEWRGLKRMECLIDAFGDGKVENAEVLKCKNTNHSTTHLDIKYPVEPKYTPCSVPKAYPATGVYKKAEFASLPSVAKGVTPKPCTGLDEISTVPRKGSPKSCKCTRITLNGPYSPGPLVKCENCWTVRRSRDKISCPAGTKLFSPQSRVDWETFIKSASPIRAPHFVIDITRPSNGCGGCTRHPMNSGNANQKTWTTQDGSPWWLRSTRYNEPNGDYHANCYLDLWHTPRDPNRVTWNDLKCNYHSKSYYCQNLAISTKPKPGSPSSCRCSKVSLTGKYSPGMLVKCEQCLKVYKSTQKNSCPVGMKIFSPRSRADWQSIIRSTKPLRAPHWIIDVTKPSNGCGGCTRHAMNSGVSNQAMWRTSDRSNWWLRKSRYNEPNGDYHANCFLDLWHNPPNADAVTFNDWNCKYHSVSYYCQPKAKVTIR